MTKFSDVLELYPLKVFVEKVIINSMHILQCRNVHLYIYSENKIFSMISEESTVTVCSVTLPIKYFKKIPDRISLHEQSLHSSSAIADINYLAYPIQVGKQLYGILIIPDKKITVTEKELIGLLKLTAYYLQRHIIEKVLLESGRSTIIMGAHPSIFRLQELLERLSQINEPVLLLGESGSGKEIWGEALHILSHRSANPFIAVNCSAVPGQNMLHDQFFGHVRGAFTGAICHKKGIFELANKGTILLDEIGDIGFELQTLLLRVVETGIIQRIGEEKIRKLDVRVLSATHKDLQKLVQTKFFRHDLYHRLAVFELFIPSLRERISDIAYLSSYLLMRFATINNLSPKICTENTLKKLQAHSWPGNIRELENVLKRAAIQAQGPTIQKQDIIFKDSFQTSTVANNAENIYQSMMKGDQDFWTAVKKPFIHRQITRNEVMSVLQMGYQTSQHNLKKLLRLFNMPPEDYSRFVAFLHRHDFR
ncbi:sigma 54-interacting transcriptional regulator [bacterium]|nr:sigma 54-interacting transcriptional regulator [bacterium]